MINLISVQATAEEETIECKNQQSICEELLHETMFKETINGDSIINDSCPTAVG